ncbi:MAG: hypothetical protein ACKOB7_04635 [Methylocystis sp.]
MQKLISINYCFQDKRVKEKGQSHVSFIEMAVARVVKCFKTKSQLQNEFHEHNVDPKANHPHNQGNKSLRSYINVTYYLLVLTYFTTNAPHEKIILQIGNITPLQDASNFRLHRVVLANSTPTIDIAR